LVSLTKKKKKHFFLPACAKVRVWLISPIGNY
jgi:hypothetical protein